MISVALLEGNIPFQLKMHKIKVKLWILIFPHLCLITDSEGTNSLDAQGL